MRPASRFLLTLIIVPLALIPACTMYSFRAEAPFQATAAVQQVNRVVVNTHNGAIRVRCLPETSTIEVKATRFASGVSAEDALAHAEKIRIGVEPSQTEPGRLDIRAEFPGERGRNEGASFDITLPSNTSLQLATGNGEVTVGGAAGETTEIRTSNGRIHATNIAGDLRAHTSNGAVDVSDVTGNVELETSNGAIDLQRAGSGHVRAQTTNGRIRAAQTRGDVDLRSSNGNIELKVAAVAERPRLSVITSNGSVDVQLPSTISARLHARTSNGSVSATWADLPVTALESNRRSLTATLREGAGTVEIESSNGAISIRTASEE